MGWFDGASEVGSSSHKHHSSSSHKKHKSSSIFGGDSHSHKHNSSRASFFGGDNYKRNSSMASFFGFPNKSTTSHHSSSSYYKRSPRSGYMDRMYRKLRRLWRDLLYYLKKHPMKVFMLVIMPLITGGALTTLLAKFGIRLPAGVERLFGAAGGYTGSAAGYGASRGYDGGMQFERTRVESSGPLDGLGAVMGSVGGLGGAVSLAKMFM